MAVIYEYFEHIRREYFAATACSTMEHDVLHRSPLIAQILLENNNDDCC